MLGVTTGTVNPSYEISLEISGTTLHSDGAGNPEELYIDGVMKVADVEGNLATDSIPYSFVNSNVSSYGVTPDNIVTQPELVTRAFVERASSFAIRDLKRIKGQASDKAEAVARRSVISVEVGGIALGSGVTVAVIEGMNSNAGLIGGLVAVVGALIVGVSHREAKIAARQQMDSATDKVGISSRRATVLTMAAKSSTIFSLGEPAFVTPEKLAPADTRVISTRVIR